jgi:hypothetical protein
MSLSHLPNTDILQRFVALQAQLADGSDWQTEPTWLRFAAQTAVLCAGEPDETAQRIRDGAETLRSIADHFGDLATPWRFVVAALLTQNGIDPVDFARELPADHELLRNAGVRHGGRYETMAIAILRHLGRGSPLEAGQAGRLKALYAGLKRHHWWLTGPDDLPACALLTCLDRTPERITEAVETNHRLLHELGHRNGGNLLHAACLLTLVDLPHNHAVWRFDHLAQEFSHQLAPLEREDYDAVALLCLLDQHADLVVVRLRGFLHDLARLEPPLYGQAGFNLAADLTILDLARCDHGGFRLRTGADLSQMLATLHRFSAAALLLTTAADPLLSGVQGEWGTSGWLTPMGMPLL